MVKTRKVVYDVVREKFEEVTWTAVNEPTVRGSEEFSCVVCAHCVA